MERRSKRRNSNMNHEVSLIKINGKVKVDVNVNGNVLFNLDNFGKFLKKEKDKNKRIDQEESTIPDEEYILGLNETEDEAPVNVEIEGGTPLKKFLDELAKDTKDNRKINIIVRSQESDDKETEEYLEAREKEDQEIELGMKIAEMKNILHDFKEALNKFSEDLNI